MSVVVISPPAVVVSPAEARAAGVFSADDDDTMILALLAAAQGTIDGPDGWLGRAIGLQTLEMSSCWPCWPRLFSLPYPPVRSIVSVKYTDGSGAVQTVDPSLFSLESATLLLNSRMPSSAVNPIRIRYVAGYGTVDGVDLPLPAPIKHAIMLMAAQLKSISPATDGDVVKEDIAGVGSIVYAAAKASEETLRVTAERLLSTYRISL